MDVPNVLNLSDRGIHIRGRLQAQTPPQALLFDLLDFVFFFIFCAVQHILQLHRLLQIR